MSEHAASAASGMQKPDFVPGGQCEAELQRASGAGVFFSATPAPQNSILRAEASQVQHSFAHLRRATPGGRAWPLGPSPAKPAGA